MESLAPSGRKYQPHEISNDDLYGLPSQLWHKDTITKFEKALSTIPFCVGGVICDIAARVFNSSSVENQQTFLDLHEKDKRGGRGLLTVSNHTHYLDDPVLPVVMMGKSYSDSWRSIFGDTSVFDNFRWVPAEKRNFFFHKNPFLRTIFRDFFGRAKVVPVLRGKGVKQDAFQSLIEKLKQGDWVHIFGEGTRTRQYGELGEGKPGVGSMVINAPDSIVLPFAHDGLEQISPYGSGAEVKNAKTGKRDNSFINFGRHLQVVVGEPFTMEKEAAGVQDNLEGQLHISALIQEKVRACLERAMALNRLRDSAMVGV